ncbi:HigB toxin protein [Leptolyngbya sp. NIES-2104]|nr:HigB toxin protein [Leptolyngbya sp. NIES-2104]
MRWGFKSKELKLLYEKKKGSTRYGATVVDAFFDIMARIDAAADERDLRQLSSCRLAALTGERDGQYSIRLNGQWCLLLVLTRDLLGEYLQIMGIEEHN